MKSSMKDFIFDILYTGGRLRNKLFLIIVAVSLLPLAALSFLAYYTVNLSHRYDVATIEDGVLLLKGKEIQNLIESILGTFEIHFNISAKQLIAVEDGKVLYLSGGGKRDFDGILDTIISENPFIEEASFVSVDFGSDRRANGLEIAKKSKLLDDPVLYADFSELEFFKDASLGNKYVSDVFFTKKGPMLTLASPVRNNENEVAGVLYGLVNLTVIQKFVREVGFGTSGYIYILDKEGRLLADSRKISGVAAENISRSGISADVMTGITPTGINGQMRYKSFWGENVIGAGVRFKTLGFSLITEWPVADADSFILEMYRQALLFMTLTVVMILFTSVFLSHKIVHPIEHLKRGTERVSKGNFDEPISITTNDEMENIATSFNEMIRGLKEYQQLKDEFVFIASHELRAPVTAIKGYLSMIEEGDAGPVSDQLKEYLNPVSQSTKRLVNLVNDLLEVARSEAGRLIIEVSKIDPKPAIKEVISELKPLAEEKGIKVEYDESGVSEILADSARIKEVMVNLLSNAFKYTLGSGDVKIWHEAKDGMLVTNVRDSGAGIPKDKQAKLFEKFYRVPDARLKGVTGTGLGLFIVKQIIEKMNGKIWFESKEGKGTTFSFSLPLAK